MAGRLTRVLGAVGSALVALVLAHSLVFLIRYGSAYGEALAHNGHDAAWTIAVVSAAVLGAGLAAAALFQLLRLNRAASETWPLARTIRPAQPRRPGRPGRPAASLGRWVHTWLTMSGRLAVVTGALLTVQENLERAGAGLPLPGLGLLLSQDYPLALPIVVGVGLAVGLVVALFRWRRDSLLARLRPPSRSQPRAAAVPRPNVLHHRPAESVLGWARGLRAPPISFDS